MFCNYPLCRNYAIWNLLYNHTNIEADSSIYSFLHRFYQDFRKIKSFHVSMLVSYNEKYFHLRRMNVWLSVLKFNLFFHRKCRKDMIHIKVDVASILEKKIQSKQAKKQVRT